MTFRAVFLLCALALSACKSRPVEPPPEPAHVPHDVATDRVRVKLDLATMRGSLQTYIYSHEGKPAPSLAELPGIDLKQLQYPGEYNYDSSSGIVTSKTFPDL